jgi:dUTP pyrophosphatase
MEPLTVGNIQFAPPQPSGPQIGPETKFTNQPQQRQMPEFIDPPVMPPIQIKVYSESKHGLPAYETSGASGMDLRANENVKIYPHETTTVGTGLYIEMAPALEMQIRPRSGLSLKTKLRVANAPGTIDSCYRGEIRVILENTGNDLIEIKDGDRIAQAVIVPVLKCAWKQVETKESLSATDRGEGGFGSTGTK